jgi:hypothetical protein
VSAGENLYHLTNGDSVVQVKQPMVALETLLWISITSTRYKPGYVEKIVKQRNRIEEKRFSK